MNKFLKLKQLLFSILIVVLFISIVGCAKNSGAEKDSNSELSIVNSSVNTIVSVEKSTTQTYSNVISSSQQNSSSIENSVSQSADNSQSSATTSASEPTYEKVNDCSQFVGRYAVKSQDDKWIKIELKADGSFTKSVFGSTQVENYELYCELENLYAKSGSDYFSIKFDKSAKTIEFKGDKFYLLSKLTAAQQKIFVGKFVAEDLSTIDISKNGIISIKNSVFSYEIFCFNQGFYYLDENNNLVNLEISPTNSVLSLKFNSVQYIKLRETTANDIAKYKYVFLDSDKYNAVAIVGENQLMASLNLKLVRLSLFTTETENVLYYIEDEEVKKITFEIIEEKLNINFHDFILEESDYEIVKDSSEFAGQYFYELNSDDGSFYYLFEHVINISKDGFVDSYYFKDINSFSKLEKIPLIKRGSDYYFFYNNNEYAFSTVLQYVQFDANILTIGSSDYNLVQGDYTRVEGNPNFNNCFRSDLSNFISGGCSGIFEVNSEVISKHYSLWKKGSDYYFKEYFTNIFTKVKISDDYLTINFNDKKYAASRIWYDLESISKYAGNYSYNDGCVSFNVAINEEGIIEIQSIGNFGYSYNYVSAFIGKKVDSGFYETDCFELIDVGYSYTDSSIIKMNFAKDGSFLVLFNRKIYRDDYLSDLNAEDLKLLSDASNKQELDGSYVAKNEYGSETYSREITISEGIVTNFKVQNDSFAQPNLYGEILVDEASNYYLYIRRKYDQEEIDLSKLIPMNYDSENKTFCFSLDNKFDGTIINIFYKSGETPTINSATNSQDACGIYLSETNDNEIMIVDENEIIVIESNLRYAKKYSINSYCGKMIAVNNSDSLILEFDGNVAKLGNRVFNISLDDNLSYSKDVSLFAVEKTFSYFYDEYSYFDFTLSPSGSITIDSAGFYFESCTSQLFMFNNNYYYIYFENDVEKLAKLEFTENKQAIATMGIVLCDKSVANVLSLATTEDIQDYVGVYKSFQNTYYVINNNATCDYYELIDNQFLFPKMDAKIFVCDGIFAMHDEMINLNFNLEFSNDILTIEYLPYCGVKIDESSIVFPTRLKSIDGLQGAYASIEDHETSFNINMYNFGSEGFGFMFYSSFSSSDSVNCDFPIFMDRNKYFLMDKEMILGELEGGIYKTIEIDGIVYSHLDSPTFESNRYYSCSENYALITTDGYIKSWVKNSPAHTSKLYVLGDTTFYQVNFYCYKIIFDESSIETIAHDDLNKTKYVLDNNIEGEVFNNNLGYQYVYFSEINPEEFVLVAKQNAINDSVFYDGVKYYAYVVDGENRLYTKAELTATEAKSLPYKTFTIEFNEIVIENELFLSNSFNSVKVGQYVASDSSLITVYYNFTEGLCVDIGSSTYKMTTNRIGDNYLFNVTLVSNSGYKYLFTEPAKVFSYTKTTIKIDGKIYTITT